MLQKPQSRVNVTVMLGAAGAIVHVQYVYQITKIMDVC
jgi:hypothetical protein